MKFSINRISPTNSRPTPDNSRKSELPRIAALLPPLRRRLWCCSRRKSGGGAGPSDLQAFICPPNPLRFSPGITIAEPAFDQQFAVLSTSLAGKLAQESTQYIASSGNGGPFLVLVTPYPQSVVLYPLIPPSITTKVIAVIPVGKGLPNLSPEEVAIAQAQEGPDTRFQVLL
jgi:hypothetical protein